MERKRQSASVRKYGKSGHDIQKQFLLGEAAFCYVGRTCFLCAKGGTVILEIFDFLEEFNRFLWGIPILLLILGTGIGITYSCRFPQIRYLPRAVRQFWRTLIHREDASDGTSPFRALCTALAATVGTGNIAGVAGAITIGGPGAVFWMWISAFIGMATKYAESTLAVRYQQCRCDGERIGGPMYMIQNGLPHRLHFLATVYAALGVAAAFGVGNATQINAVISSLEESASAYGIVQNPHTPYVAGGVIAIVVVWLVSGGAKKIGEIMEYLIPIVSAGYILLCVVAICCHMDALPGVFRQILRGAFRPQAVTGGMVGSVFLTLRIGVSRGTFTNEAGMGTASMAHGSARVSHPVEQGLMGIMEVFLDTIVICSLTAFAILTSGVEIPYGTVAGAELTAKALSASFGPWASAFLCGCLCLFALGTILGWGLYAGRCAEYLFGKLRWRVFALCQGFCVLLGVVLNTGTVWTLSELMNGLMAIPNLIALLLMMPELIRLTGQYGKLHKNQHLPCMDSATDEHELLHWNL